MISLRGVLKKEGDEQWKWTGSWSFGSTLDTSKSLPFSYVWDSEIIAGTHEKAQDTKTKKEAEPLNNTTTDAVASPQADGNDVVMKDCATSEPSSADVTTKVKQEEEVVEAQTKEASNRKSGDVNKSTDDAMEVEPVPANAEATVEKDVKMISSDKAVESQVSDEMKDDEVVESIPNIVASDSQKNQAETTESGPSAAEPSEETGSTANASPDPDQQPEKSEKEDALKEAVKEVMSTTKNVAMHGPTEKKTLDPVSDGTRKDLEEKQNATHDDESKKSSDSTKVKSQLEKEELKETASSETPVKTSKAEGSTVAQGSTPESQKNQQESTHETNSRNQTSRQTLSVESSGGTTLPSPNEAQSSNIAEPLKTASSLVQDDKSDESNDETMQDAEDGTQPPSKHQDDEGELEWKLDDGYTDAATKHTVPKMGRWKGHFKTLGTRKNTFSEIVESMELYFNATPPPDAQGQFPDEEGVSAIPALGIPSNHVHVRGLGENQYGSFELVGLLNLPTLTLSVQRLYVRTTPRSPKSSTRKRRASTGDNVRQSRKRLMSWKRRAALDTEEEATKRIRRPREGSISISVPKKVAPSVTSPVRHRRPTATTARPLSLSAASLAGAGLKLPAAGDASFARWRAAHFLYYQRQEAPQPTENGSAPPPPTTPKYVIYEGEMRDSQREGRGICLFHDLIYEGQWLNDTEHGHGTLFSSDRKRLIYEGEWERGRMHGQGTYHYSPNSYYKGEWRENLRHGNGLYVLPDGSRLSGQWRDGLLNGRGVLTWPDGSVYDGEWKDGKRHGQGLLRASDGFVYDGNWVLNAMDGRGSATYPNGQEYHGLFSNGRREGRGTIVFTNTAVYEGRFRSDAIDGQGTMKMTRSTVVETPSEEANDYMIPISFQSDISHIHRKAGFTVGGN